MKRTLLAMPSACMRTATYMPTDIRLHVQCHLPARTVPHACMRSSVSLYVHCHLNACVVPSACMTSRDFDRVCGLVLVKRRRVIAFIHIIQFFMDFHLGYRFLCARTNKGRNFFPSVYFSFER